MDWKIASKWYDGKYTNINMVGESGTKYYNLTAQVISDVTKLQDNELVALALEDVFKTLFVDRAMPEAIQKVDEYTSKIAETDKLMTDVNAALEQVKKESEITQLALMEITILLNPNIS